LTEPFPYLDALRRGPVGVAPRRLGVEHECFVLRPDGRPVSFEEPGGVEEVLRRAAELSGGEVHGEDGRALGVALPDGGSLSLEPGAQLEWASPPHESASELAVAQRESASLFAELAAEFDLRFVPVGAHPTARPDDLPRIPKARYGVMEPWMRAHGDLGLWMMKTTCGVQANLDAADEGEAMEMLRLALWLSPLLVALSANSAFAAGRDTGFRSWRGHVWTRTAPERCGIPRALLAPGLGFADYVEWAWSAPMLFVERPGPDGAPTLVDLRGTSFRDWAARGEATAADWELHLSTLFPEARFRPQLEVRSLDAAPAPLALALTTLVRAVLERREAREAAARLVGRWSEDQLYEAWHAAHREALAAPDPAGGVLLERARELRALAAPNPDEEEVLAPLDELLADGRSLAERAHEQGFDAWLTERLAEAAPR